ncbi:sulfotransferase [Glaciecola petra]|uniref:Sulfotransferase n=1 Tax=Glaciecola petra TaxID=3075602 RepID=A0ABU2ZMA6_9ALTE|nr:sulfotransferase [Aestuariibacter sp. P117]MDT0593763.1 sulfotransferase [Aestuariibacter sp. P117]
MNTQEALKNAQSFPINQNKKLISETQESDTKLPDKPLIFIMGLHRSGTTFLYESLTEYYGTAKLSIFDIVYFPELLNISKNNAENEYKHALSSFFHALAYSKRGNDSISLGPNTAEEYGWILKRWGSAFSCNQKTLPLMRQIIHKLSAINTDSQALILKNPWDIGQGKFISDNFPEAKFIYIKRSPKEILNSEINNALHFTETKDPLLSLLSNSIPITRRLTKTFTILRLLLGRRVFTKLIAKLMTGDIVNNLQKYQHDIKQIEKSKVFELDYSDLIDNAHDTYTALTQFLRLTPKVASEIPKAHRSKKPVSEVVESASVKLNAQLLASDLSRFISSKHNS